MRLDDMNWAGVSSSYVEFRVILESYPQKLEGSDGKAREETRVEEGFPR
jgi:hypothetical protein